jgi:8-oxo-dGTP pyrophosphatase MutT (NUDIX family)
MMRVPAVIFCTLRRVLAGVLGPFPPMPARAGCDAAGFAAEDRTVTATPPLSPHILPASQPPVAPPGIDPLLATPGWRKLSCGLVIVNDQAELLLCHVTGQDHWDLPKGGAGPGEPPLLAALRETREETGLLLDAADLLDLGRLPYRPRKDLHLFATRLPRLPLNGLHCESRFSQGGTGARLPEMDGFAWVPFAEVAARCTPKLAAVLCGQLDLAQLLARLQARNLLADVEIAPPAALHAPGWPAAVCRSA